MPTPPRTPPTSGHQPPDAPAPGDAVRTPFGRGVVREVRNHGRLLIEVAGRALEFRAADVSRTTPEAPARRGSAPRPTRPSASSAASASSHGPREIDLHGRTVEEALEIVDRALNEALLADALELRVIHGRSGGRLRAALHTRLRGIPSVRGFRLDPGNPGVTLVSL